MLFGIGSSKRAKPEYELVPGAVVLDRYVLDEPFGFGGTAMVWRGRVVDSGKVVAIKVSLTNRPNTSRNQDRLVREFKLLSRVCSPHVLAVHDFGELPDGRPVFVSELMIGETLREYMETGELLSLVDAFEITVGLMRALNDVHACNIVHRDIKPDNIFLVRTDDGSWRVKLFDFGIAKVISENVDGISAADDPEVAELLIALTGTEMTVGTPEYMAPEQISANSVGPYTDVYAAGIVLHEMLFGIVPYTGKNFFEIAHRHLEGVLPPLPADLPIEAQRVIWKALACEYEDRYQDSAEMIAAIESALSNEAVRSYSPVLEDEDDDLWDPYADDEPLLLTQPKAEQPKTEDVPSVIPRGATMEGYIPTDDRPMQVFIDPRAAANTTVMSSSGIPARPMYVGEEEDEVVAVDEAEEVMLLTKVATPSGASAFRSDGVAIGDGDPHAVHEVKGGE